MKTTAVAVTALLASIAFAQPYHGRHFHKKDLHKRKLVVVTTTCTETATLIIDQDGTSLIEPTPAQFYPSTTSDETTSTTSTTSTSTSMSNPTTSSTSTTSTSTYVQPQPTTPTIQAQETTPTTTIEAPAYTQATSEAAAPTSGSGSSSGGSGGSYSGDITYYEIGMGSCGIDSSGTNPSGTSPSDPAVIALPRPQMQVWTGNPNLNPLCGKMIKITANGKTGYGKVLDTCGDCLTGSIDTNVGAFSLFYDPQKGRAPVSWEFM